jgi:hypothetical protein
MLEMIQILFKDTAEAYAHAFTIAKELEWMIENEHGRGE